MGRRYARKGLGGRPGLLSIVLALAVLATAVPAASFTLGTHPRPASSNVVDDIDGTLGLDVATSVRQKRVQRLVTVTNRLGVSVSVTVAVTNSNQHVLYLDGVEQGTQATFTLADGASQQVDVEAHSSEDFVVFDVTASAADVTVNANGRSVEVTGGNGGGPGGG